ncbi:hypothetical protein [Arthrobacter monumenti]
MKKLLREDGPVLLVSLVITYLVFQGVLSWGWNIIGAAVFAVVIGLISAIAIQAIIVLWDHKRGSSKTDEADSAGADSAGTGNREHDGDAPDEIPEDGSSLDRRGDDRGDGTKPGWRKSFETDDPSEDDGSASGTGAEQSGPRGPVRRTEEYRSSLEDPD